MKISIWDILSILLVLGTIIVLALVIQIFSDPSGSLNPFPPPTLPSRLVLPTYTNTPMRLPATWTPTMGGAATSTEEPSGLKPTWTLLPTRTSFVVNTWTPTATETLTPTITRTPTVTRTPTQTPLPLGYSSGGTQSVSTSRNFDASGTGWAQIYIDEPNHQGFGQQAIALTCTTPTP